MKYEEDKQQAIGVGDQHGLASTTRLTLAGMRTPLLVILGTLDDPGTSDAMRHLARTVRGARLEVFEGAAHMVNLEQPDRFNALLREFLGAH